MTGIRRAVSQRGFSISIPMIDLIEGHDGDHIVIGIAQDNVLADGRQFFWINCQRDGKRPKSPIRKAHFAQDAHIIGFSHEGRERREAAGSKQFQVAKIPHGDLDG